VIFHVLGSKIMVGAQSMKLILLKNDC